MDFLTLLTYVVGFVETAALLGTLIFVTRAMKAEKSSPEKKNQFKKAVAFLLVYLVLHLLRNSVFGL